MKTQLDTPNREAFEHYRQAMSCIDTYRASGNREFVEKSYVLLDAAHSADPQWTKPIYLKSLLKDLAGNPQATIDELEQLKDVPNLPFSLEVKLNLGAAHYHRYGEEHLNQAEALFKEVKSKATAALEPLSLLASSSLAQVYGMRVLLKRPEELEERKKSAEEWYERCRSEADEALKGLAKWKESKEFRNQRGEMWLAEEIEWAATNAVGFAGSFFSDYLEAGQRIHVLEKSISFFRKDLELRPNHWATLSNIASAELRLGNACRLMGENEQGNRLLLEALDHIDLVLTPEIRPNYAFALYERGRILRLLGQFGDAISSLVRASKVPEKLRDVSCGSIASEIVRAANRQTDFPGAPV